MRNVWFVAALVASICFITFPKATLQGQVGTSLFPVSIAAPDIDPRHIQLMTAMTSEFDRELDYLNYPSINAMPVIVTEIHTPIVNRHVILRFDTVAGHRSVFVAIFPLEGPGVKILPVAYNGLYPGSSPVLDPHNIAIFNSTIGTEAPELKDDADRVRLAILYLSLFDEHPQIVGTENEATRGDAVKFESEVSRRLRPSVTADPNGGFTILAFATTGDSAKFDEFSLSFDKVGMLRGISHDIRTLQYLLRK